ncbi:hypothetical protein CAC42_8175 [Sphaceloma murrayae]|uniref:Uncharacterized protein n=1 Tax=Sphaceloma murrayae TaxID=2082308 RepID=A0A2K1QJ27_9PEZI|nr:hypothetical protein CAC42_8175 [Sphaceloma murrayae]
MVLPLAAPLVDRQITQCLSPDTRQRLTMLRTKLTEEVARRGLLIKHPHDDYELLEERVLQALELEECRIGKDGHFLSPTKNGINDEMDTEGEDRVDSGTELEDEVQCETCDRLIRGNPRGFKDAGEWDIQIFAGNGRIQAGTWAVAWEDMETVDVLVTPWLSERERKTLEDTAEKRRHDQGAEVTASATSGRQALAEEKQMLAEERLSIVERVIMLEVELEALRESQHVSSTPPDDHRQRTDAFDDLPPAFRSEQIPVDVLLGNYVRLMAKDVRNILIFALLAVSVMLSIQVVALRSVGQLEKFDSCSIMGQSIAESIAKLVDVSAMGGASCTMWNDPVPSSEVTLQPTHDKSFPMDGVAMEVLDVPEAVENESMDTGIVQDLISIHDET